MSVRIQQEDFDLGAEYAALRAAAPGAGAIVCFSGLVRDWSANKEQAVTHLALEHFAGFTEALCEQIIAQANRRFSLLGARVVHRIGKLMPNDQIVLVITAAEHRLAAFQGAEFIMDYLKSNATIWKKEAGLDGGEWLGLKQADQHAIERWETN